MAGHEDDRDVDVRAGELRLEIQAAQSRQPDVEDEAARRIRKLALEKLGSGGEYRRLQADSRNRSLSASRNEASSSMIKTVATSRQNILVR